MIHCDKKKQGKHKCSAASKQVHQLPETLWHGAAQCVTLDVTWEPIANLLPIGHMCNGHTQIPTSRQACTRAAELRTTGGGNSPTPSSQLLPSPRQRGDCMKQIMHERRRVQKADYSPIWEESPTGQEEKRQREKLDQLSGQNLLSACACQIQA